MTISTQCLECKHYIAFSTCEAYPDKIPQEIFDGTVEHTEPYPGDNGIMFEPINSLSKLEIPDDLIEQAGFDPKKMSPDQLKAMFAKLQEKGLLKPKEGEAKPKGKPASKEPEPTGGGRPGLVKKKVTVHRGGKTFEQYRWVKAGDDEPKEKPKKGEEKPTGEVPGKAPVKPKGPIIQGLNKPEGEGEEAEEKPKKEEPKAEDEEIKGKEFMDWQVDEEIPGGVTVGSVVDVGKFGKVTVKDIIHGVIIGEDDKPYAVTSIEEVISNPDKKEEPEKAVDEGEDEESVRSFTGEDLKKAEDITKSYTDDLEKTEEGKKLIKAATDYTGGDYKLFNNYLRSDTFEVRRLGGKKAKAGKKEKQKVDEQMKVLSDFLKDAPKTQGIVYRGMGWNKSTRGGRKQFDDFINEVENNKSLILKSFTSTTADKNVAEDFSGHDHSIMFEIQSKNGVYLDGTSAFEKEHEVLFDKNSDFDVDSIDRSDYPGRVVIKLKESGTKAEDVTKMLSEMSPVQMKGVYEKLMKE